MKNTSRQGDEQIEFDAYLAQEEGAREFHFARFAQLVCQLVVVVFPAEITLSRKFSLNL